ncbi:hypothetical protein Nepgr_029516 [Nepenthes gracilis]|uniref:Remorin C-terminal domain-containing protein n=1 Tax=Nepenthes gracilis TaxID=150966 RepID=A0AAD3Y3B9_NEPGR|nr:hypothetical protein Nepgr_029516 [Nepenthes gracilis]
MRSIEDKGCLNYGQAQEISTNNCTINFEFHKGSGSNRVAASHHHRTALGKPAPSKWDDAQKWLVGLSRGGGGEKKLQKTKPRNSNADDTRLIAPTPQQETNFSSGEEEVEKEESGACPSSNSPTQYEVETKKVDYEESYWQINKPVVAVDNASVGVRSVCVRDMGTEMTPTASQEPSRTATPLKAATPRGRSPISSGTSTPIRFEPGGQGVENYQTSGPSIDYRAGQASPLRMGNDPTRLPTGGAELGNGFRMEEASDTEHAKKMNPLESRAMAWDEAERAKYMARFRQEEVKIQAWENHEKRKAEMEMKKMEVKAERLKARAQEKYANKLAATRRIAEERRANAEAKLNENAVKTSEKADYLRRTGHLASSFSLRLPSFCW